VNYLQLTEEQRLALTVVVRNAEVNLKYQREAPWEREMPDGTQAAVAVVLEMLKPAAPLNTLHRVGFFGGQIGTECPLCHQVKWRRA